MLVVSVCALTGLTGAPAMAETSTPSPTPSREAETGAPTITITSPQENSFVSGTRVNLAGTKSADSSVSVPSLTGGEPLCVVNASPSTSWQCTGVVLPSGTIGLVAREYANGRFISETPPLTLRVLGAPAFTTAGPYVNAGSLDGVGWDGASIRILFSSPVSAVQSCGQTVGDGYWYCGIDPGRFPSGTYQVQVQQSWPGSITEWSPASASSTLVIDRDIPSAPVVTSPTEGAQITSQPVQFSGTGEADAYLDVYVDDVSVCNTRVSGTTWSCTGQGIGAGPHAVRAVQQDAAGNVSSPSASVAMTIASAPSATAAPPVVVAPTRPPAAPAPTPAPTAVPAPSVAPVVPAPQPETPTPSPTPVVPDPPDTEADATPPSTWGTPTKYGDAITTPGQTLTNNVWPLAAVLALGWLLLIAVPLRMVATTLRGRLALHGPHLTGRNRLSSERRQVEEALPTVSTHPAFVAGGMLLGAALLAVLASGIQGEVRYIRLTVAVAVGLAVLNTGAALTVRWAGRGRGFGGDIRLVPLFLAVGAVTAIASRVAGVQPPLVMGIVVGATFAMGIAARERGIVQLAQVAAIALLATVAWVLWGAIGGATGTADGFWTSGISEILAATCLAGFGSALLLLLPVLSLPGRAIFEWSPPIWAGATLTVAALAAAMFIGERFPLAAVTVGAAVVAVLCVSIWAWSRYVQQPVHGR